MSTGTLYIVSTPIGNLEDLTFRARRVLSEVDIIAAEDTRRAGTLLAAYGIKTRVTSFHSYNLTQKTPQLISLLEQGKSLAMISDSGTPGISDPGSVFISSCLEKGVNVTAVPGPTAFVTALVLSGKPTHKFVFEGFLSNKAARRRKQLESFREEERTVILYESPHRIVKFLEDFIDVLGDREIAVARELTKKFEEIRRDKASSQLARFRKEKPRGEFVIVF
ncbi:MAG: 16S rRNA (cytidine(1402)-2'-O)-methyltransferase [Candidatus Omnitrophota bacterium]